MRLSPELAKLISANNKQTAQNSINTAESKVREIFNDEGHIDAIERNKLKNKDLEHSRIED